MMLKSNIHIPKSPPYNVKTAFGGFPLKDYIEERAVNIANHIVESNATVHQTAKTFWVSKNTVRADVIS